MVDLCQIIRGIYNADQIMRFTPFWGVEHFYKCLYDIVAKKIDLNHFLMVDHQVIEGDGFATAHTAILNVAIAISSTLVV